MHAAAQVVAGWSPGLVIVLVDSIALGALRQSPPLVLTLLAVTPVIVALGMPRVSEQLLSIGSGTPMRGADLEHALGVH